MGRGIRFSEGAQRNRKTWLIQRNKIEIAPEEAQIVDLLGNNLRINVLNMLKELKENLDKELEGTRKIRDKRERNYKKESNSTKAEMKNMLQDSRTDLRKNQWIWRQDNLNYSGRSRKKKNEVDKRLRDLWDTIKHKNICIMGIPESAQRGRSRKI